MKRLILISLIFSLTMFFTGCVDDFLSHRPPVERVQDNFYQTQNDAEQALYAAY